MKTLLLGLTLFSTLLTYGQWEYKVIDNKFDKPFKKAYVLSENNGTLSLQKEENKPLMYITDTYYCDDAAEINLVFTLANGDKKHNFFCYKSSDNDTYFFNENTWTEEFIQDFKNAKKCLIRINQTYCQEKYYEFNFTNSTKAYDFITKD